jgi:hypothetical protein
MEQSFLVYFGYLLPVSFYKCVFSSLVSIKGSIHIGTPNTMHCSIICEIFIPFSAIHAGACALTRARARTHTHTHMHAHIDKKHATGSGTTIRWHILLEVYNRNKCCLKRVSCLMKQHQTSAPTLYLTGRNYSALCSKLLSPSVCMCLFGYSHFELHRNKIS